MGVRVGGGGVAVGVGVGVGVGVASCGVTRVGVGVAVGRRRRHGGRRRGRRRTPVRTCTRATSGVALVARFFTVTSTRPSACAPVVAVIVVEFTTLTPVAATPPIVTVAPPAKPVPVIVTARAAGR